jgi:transposase
MQTSLTPCRSPGRNSSRRDDLGHLNLSDTHHDRRPSDQIHTYTHKITGVRQAINAAGATLLYLPPYSPDFNPIEMAFSKLKALLRKAAPRTVTDLWHALASALDDFAPTECQNSFAAAGYDPD